MTKNRNNKNMEIKENWKRQSQDYLREVQTFLDKAENIENEELRKEILIQMLKCDKELTKIAEEKFREYYEQGKKC